ncbi:MAG: hypothetical protein GEU94_07230 [Micromonosporaceae bacterium]|nr:hypothetical protein [Micromonosporaceae bacterium]
MTSPGRRSARREFAAAVVGCLAGGGGALLATRQVWAERTVGRQPPLSPLRETVTGADLAAWAPAAALVVLAAAFALYAARGQARRAVAALTAVSGGAIVAAGVRGLATAGDSGRQVVDGGLWPAATLAGGLLALAAGALALLRSADWPSMGTRYERPEGESAATGRNRKRTAQTPDDPAAMWDALDSGADPTAER